MWPDQSRGPEEVSLSRPSLVATALPAALPVGALPLVLIFSTSEWRSLLAWLLVGAIALWLVVVLGTGVRLGVAGKPGKQNVWWAVVWFSALFLVGPIFADLCLDDPPLFEDYVFRIVTWSALMSVSAVVWRGIAGKREAT